MQGFKQNKRKTYFSCKSVVTYTLILLLAFPIFNVFVIEKCEVIPSLLRLRIEEMASSTSDGIPLYGMLRFVEYLLFIC